MENIVDENINYKEERPYYIYIHTCPNRMVYVGKTKNPIRRWNNGKGYKHNKMFYEAIQLFGWENIKHEIVAKTYYGWVARDVERMLIGRFKRLKKTYNLVNEEKPAYTNKKYKKIKKCTKVTESAQ